MKRVILIIFLIVVVIELLGRAYLFVVNDFTWKTLALYKNDDKFGYIPNPNSYNLMYSFNSKGYRAPEFNSEKGKGVIRIITLGGSTTFGSGNRFDETWPYLLEKKLNGNISGTPKYEVINGAVSGWQSEQLLNRLENDVFELDPDIVLLWIGWNEGEVVNIWKKQSALSFFLFDNSIVYRVWHKFLMKLNKSSILINPDRNAEENFLRFTEDNKNKEIFDSYEKNIRKMVELCKNNFIKVYLIEFPFLFKTDNLDAEKKRFKGTKFGKNELVFSYIPLFRKRDLIFERLEVIARQYNIGVIDLVKEFEVYEKRKRAELFSDPIHLLAKGNQLVADVIFEKIK